MAKQKPSLLHRWVLAIVVIVLLGSALPVLAGFGFVLGILFGWLSKAMTKS
jgi:hypothetical protein